MADRNLVFFSYRHDADGQRWLSLVRGGLQPRLDTASSAWSDHRIQVGERWSSSIPTAIEYTRVALFCRSGNSGISSLAAG